MPVQFKDYYETLGVAKAATDDEIRKSFRKLARQYHPDVAKDKKTAEAKFKEINEAYEVLGDPEKRKRYDTLGADWERGGRTHVPPGWERHGGPANGEKGFDFEFGGTGFSDFFEAFFGAAGRPQHRGAGGMRGAMAQGQDVEADIMVTLDEAWRGSRRKISFRRTGKSKVETYEVTIPPGVREGQRIRLAGQGGAGIRGGAPGDLLLKVKLAQHPDFRVDGADLIHEVTLEAWQAVLGCEVSVPTLEGNVRLKIPAGTQFGQRLRLKHRGLPKLGKDRGDLFVSLDITLPKTLTPAERDAWDQVAAASRPAG